MLYFSSEEKVDILPLRKCLDFLQSEKLPEAGKRVDLKDGIYCVGGSYETLPESEAVWEGHKKYVDLHCVLTGEERIGIVDSRHCQPGPYHHEDDFYLAEAKVQKWVEMKPGSALCLFPEDVHQVKVRMNPEKPVNTTKVVFKIPVEMFRK